MKRILLLPNFIKPRTAALLQRVCKILQSYGLIAVALLSDRAFWEEAGITTVGYTSMMTLDAVKKL